MDVIKESSFEQNKVGIIMGSDSDFPVMSEAAKVLKEMEIEYEINVVSAHRTPDRMYDYAKNAEGKGISVIIAGAGGSAHLPGMVASLTCIPVIGVPIRLKNLGGIDSLLSIVQMPAGIPVATVSINGGAAAGLLAAKLIGIKSEQIRRRVACFMKNLETEREVDLDFNEITSLSDD